jgi:hypothetical protein
LAICIVVRHGGPWRVYLLPHPMDFGFFLTPGSEVSASQWFNNGSLAFTTPVNFSVLGDERTAELFGEISAAFAQEWSFGHLWCYNRMEFQYPDHWLEVGGGFDPLGWNSCLDSDPEPLFMETSPVIVDKEPAFPERPKVAGALGRLRPRGKLTRSLQTLGASFEGWWRDLAGDSSANRALAWFQAYTGGSVKVEFVRTLPTSKEDGEPSSVMGIRLDGESKVGGSLVICPELVASLACVRAFRGMDAGLLPSLRSRARLWAKEREISDLDLSLFISGSCTFSVLATRSEVAAYSLLGTDASRWATSTFGALSSGRVDLGGVRLGYWESIRRAIRWTRPAGVLEPTVTGFNVAH